MLEQSYYDRTDEIIASHGKCPASLIPVLHEIQETYRYLPGELLTYVAEQIGITESKAYSVATFYENFSFEPKGKYVIKVCDGTACHVRKSTPVREYLCKTLGLDDEKHTTDDLMFTVETVSCLGACGLAPALMVNEKVYSKMTPEKAEEMLQELRNDASANVDADADASRADGTSADASRADGASADASRADGASADASKADGPSAVSSSAVTDEGGEA